MSFNTPRIISYLVSILLIFLGALPFFSKIIDFINQKSLQIFPENSLFLILIIFIGIIILSIANNWNEKFKGLGRLFLEISIFFLFISIFYFNLGLYNENLGDEIQSSIDYVAVNSMDKIIANEYEDLFGEEINILVADNFYEKTYYNTNLTESEANELIEELEIKVGEKSKIELVKFFISEVNKKLKSSPMEGFEIGIPISVLREQAKNYNPELMLSADFDAELFSTYLSMEKSAKIKIIYAENETTITKKISELEDTEIELIWENLGLDFSVSKNTKEIITKIFLAEIEKQNLQPNSEYSIPIASFASLITGQQKQMLEYDLFAENIDTRLENLQNLKSDCNQNNNTNNTDQFCEFVKQTDFDVMMENAQSQFGSNSEVFGEITKESVEDFVVEKSREKLKYLILAIVFFTLGVSCLYYHYFRIEKSSQNLAEILKEVSRAILIQSIWLTGIIAFILYSLKPENLSSFIPSEMNKILTGKILSEMPIIETFKNLLVDTFYIGLILLFTSLVSYLVLRFKILIKKDKSSPSEPQNEQVSSK
ncbi:MAG: hypothetical protein ACOCXG_03470 [Nanoarchaeota archaeon]